MAKNWQELRQEVGIDDSVSDDDAMLMVSEYVLHLMQDAHIEDDDFYEKLQKLQILTDKANGEDKKAAYIQSLSKYDPMYEQRIQDLVFSQQMKLAKENNQRSGLGFLKNKLVIFAIVLCIIILWIIIEMGSFHNMDLKSIILTLITSKATYLTLVFIAGFYYVISNRSE